MFCGCLLSAVLVCLLYFFNQIFKSCNPSWPLPFDLALSHTARPSRAVARRVLILGHDGRHQAKRPQQLPWCCPHPLASPSRLRGGGGRKLLEGSRNGELLRDESALHMLSVRRGDLSGFKLGDRRRRTTAHDALWASAPRAAACSLLFPGSLTRRRAPSQYP